MKFGIYLPNFGPFGDARALARLAALAEQAGWDGIFIWDHINRALEVDVVDATVALAAMASATSRIRLGAMVTPLARRRPWKVARESASLDRLSGGRLVLGVGLGSGGGSQIEWANFGEETDLKRRAGMLDEALQIITGLWSGRPFAFEGQYYTVRESRFRPSPLQSPRIPVWVAGNWPNRPPFRRMARWDGMMPEVDLRAGDELAQLAEAVRFTKEQRAGAGLFDVAYSVPPLRRPDPASAPARVAAFAEASVTWLLEQLYPRHFGADWEGAWPLEEMEAYLTQGPPRA
jgi:alkanesulfonate monooxygenase SsuD/methylene tetrahydromethanopterin reductase-like flavin-dependent oxidoreductase (luciferase family)